MTDLRLPDFVIAGAPRCGTTWLYEVANRHTGIAMAAPVAPEPKFFLVDEIFEKGLAHYSRTWFENIPNDLMAGEKSANYMESPTAAIRLAQSLPRIKLVFLLRDPVARAHSNYLWSRQNGWETERFTDALASEAERLSSLPDKARFARPYAYFDRGRYAHYLATWFDHFPRENILVLKFEDIGKSPESVADTFSEFLGLDRQSTITEGLDRINAAQAEQPSPLPEPLVATLRDRYREENRNLPRLLGWDPAWF